MKKFLVPVLVFVLTVSLLAGCRSNKPDTTTTAPISRPTTVPTTAPTTAPTVAPTTTPTTAPTSMPTTDSTDSGMDDMIPGPEDTIDPTNGANNDTTDARSRRARLPRS